MAEKEGPSTASNLNSSNIIAAISLLVALISSGFAIYQWVDSDRDSKIKASIEVSRNFLRERKTEKVTALMVAVLGRPMSYNQMVQLSETLDEYEYIALMANNDRLDRKYLSQDVQCSIYLAKMAAVHLSRIIPFPKSLIKREISRFEPDPFCREVFSEITNTESHPLENLPWPSKWLVKAQK